MTTREVRGRLRRPEARRRSRWRRRSRRSTSQSRECGSPPRAGAAGPPLLMRGARRWGSARRIGLLRRETAAPVQRRRTCGGRGTRRPAAPARRPFPPGRARRGGRGRWCATRPRHRPRAAAASEAATRVRRRAGILTATCRSSPKDAAIYGSWRPPHRAITSARRSPAVNPVLSVVRPPFPQLVVPDSLALGEEFGGGELGKLLRCRAAAA